MLRITGTYTLNDDKFVFLYFFVFLLFYSRLLSIVPFYEGFTTEGWVIRHRALIVPSQSYICRNTIVEGEEEERTSVTHRILFGHLKNVQIASENIQKMFRSLGKTILFY